MITVWKYSFYTDIKFISNDIKIIVNTKECIYFITENNHGKNKTLNIYELFMIEKIWLQ